MTTQIKVRKEYMKKYRPLWYAKNPGKHAAYCRDYYHADPERSLTAQKRWRLNHPDKYKRYLRNNHLRKHGLTEEQYQKFCLLNDGLCWCCNGQPTGRWKKLQIDHDHVTGKFRGLLCLNCNAALGLLKDSFSNVQAVLAYLKIHQDIPRYPE